MITAHKIREKLQIYLANGMTLRQFIIWFYARAWEVEIVPRVDVGLFDLICQVKLCIAEMATSRCTEDELRKMLRPFAL